MKTIASQCLLTFRKVRDPSAIGLATRLHKSVSDQEEKHFWLRKVALFETVI